VPSEDDFSTTASFIFYFPVETWTKSVATDNSLVIVGSKDGSVHALERPSGEQLWQGSITEEVGEIAFSPYNVWIRGRESGVFALRRDTGETVHRSSIGSGGGIAVHDDILMTDASDGVAVYWIEES
jgi:outer membrane protein assembly factor BamB